MGRIEEPLPSQYAVLLGMGTALYLVGTATFRLVFRIRPVAPRLVAAMVVAATAFAGVAQPAFLQVALLIAIVVALVTIESPVAL